MEYEKLSAKNKTTFFSYVIKLLEEKNYGGVARLLRCRPDFPSIKSAALALAQRRALERQWERFEKKMYEGEYVTNHYHEWAWSVYLHRWRHGSCI